MAQSMSATVRAIKSTKRFVAQRAAITLTSSAVNRVRQLLSTEPQAIGLRVGVKTRGCSGLSYTLDYATEKKKMDEEVNQDGVKIWPYLITGLDHWTGLLDWTTGLIKNSIKALAHAFHTYFTRVRFQVALIILQHYLWSSVFLVQLYCERFL